MIYRGLSLILLLTFASPAAFAAADPLKSLFLFQQQMAENGITSAMMKLGKMYENGEGIDKSNAKALVMYQQAFDSGYLKATDDIKRLSKLKQNPKNINKSKQQQKQRQQADAEKLKNKRNKEAQAKTLQLNKQAREKAARDQKQQQQTAQARKTYSAKQAQIKAAKEARIARDKKAKAAKTAKLKAARKAEAEKFAYKSLGTEYEEDEETLIYSEDEETLISSEDKSTPEKGFKSDPCKSKAARYLSICK